MLERLLAVSVLGGFVGLDTTAAWQTLFSHPLLSCVLAGYLFGEPQLGLFFGIIFELIWLYDIPVGGAKSPDGNLGSFVGFMVTATLKDTGSFVEPWLVLVGLIYTVLVAYFLGKTVVLMRKNNLHLIRLADRSAEKGNPRGVALAHLLGVLHSFLHAAFWGVLSYMAGILIIPKVLALLPKTAVFGLPQLQALFLGIGLAVMFQMFVIRKRIHLFLLSVLGGLGIGLLL